MRISLHSNAKWGGTYVNQYVSSCGPYGKRPRLDLDVTKVDLEDGDGDDDILHLERFAELGQTDCYFGQSRPSPADILRALKPRSITAVCHEVDSYHSRKFQYQRP